MNFNNLINSPIFNNTLEKELQKILENVEFHTNKYKKGALICLRGDECRGLNIVMSGSVTGEMINEEGKRVVIEEISAPQPIAIAFIFGKNNFYPVNVIASDNCEILFIPKPSLLKIMSENTIILENILELVSQKAQFLSKRIWSSFMKKGIKGKFCEYLLNNTDNQGIVKLSHSIKELAEHLGTQRPSLSRVVSELKDSGVIEKKGSNTFIIINKKLIKEIAGF